MNKTYVVTACNRGLGLEFARQLSGRGDRVIGTARDPESATELKRLASLRRAYPNYFADTRVFLELMRQALSGKQKRIYEQVD